MSELTAVEREEQLVVMRKRMGKALRKGETAEYERLAATYGALKAEHVLRTHEEYVAERRAARVALRAQEPQEAPRRWRLPRGFASPLAAQRAREGRPVVPVVPVGRPALSPWRRGSMASEVIWRPGR